MHRQVSERVCTARYDTRVSGRPGHFHPNSGWTGSLIPATVVAVAGLRPLVAARFAAGAQPHSPEVPVRDGLDGVAEEVRSPDTTGTGHSFVDSFYLIKKILSLSGRDFANRRFLISRGGRVNQIEILFLFFW